MLNLVTTSPTVRWLPARGVFEKLVLIGMSKFVRMRCVDGR